MLRTKKADRLVALFTAVMLIAAVCLWGIVEPVQGDGSHEVGYESLLFDPSRVHTIDIQMDDWDELIASATMEEYRQCEMTIDGEKIGTVAIRAKGNTSLSSVASLGSTRYSFKVEFDQYVKGKTYHGLDKLSLNNMIQDATMMKDYLSYTLMNRMGVPSSRCSYVQINVNGEPWGLYLAVEGVEDGFLERNGMAKGELYKPDSLSFGGGRGNGRDFDIENFRVSEDENGEDAAGSENANSEGAASTQTNREDEGSSGGSSGDRTRTDGTQQGTGTTDQNAWGDFAASDGNGTEQNAWGDFAESDGNGAEQETNETWEWSGDDFAASNGDSADTDGFGGSGGGRADGESDDEGFGASNGGGGFNFGMGSDDVKLVYTNDNPESYSNIFNNAKTDITTRDKNRLIASLKKLSAKEDLDSVVDKEEVITYLAVHNFLCNDDSYTGMMVHNYYLYEENGKLSIIPWDYNLGFGGFSAGGNATSTVNSPIDNPVSSGTTDSRPLVGWIFSDEESLNAYHETYDRFISECIESGWLDNEISRVQEMINPYLEKDASLFYSMEDYEKAVSTLRTFCAKRGESIRGQLDGTIPSTSNGQRNSSALIDASEISTSAMGSMSGMGGGFGGGNTDWGDWSDRGTDAAGGDFGASGGDRADNGEGGSFGGSAGGKNTQESPPEQGGTPETAEAAAKDDTSRDGTTETTGSAEPEKPAESAAASETADATEPPAVSADGDASENTNRRSGRTENGDRPEDGSGGGAAGFSEGGGFPGGGFSGWGGTGRGYSSNIWIWTAVCAALLLAAVLIVRKAGSHND